MTVPSDIAGLQLWLQADTGVYNDAGVTLATNGQTVQQWNDISGNTKNATQSSSGLRPTFVTNFANGLPAVRFTAASNTQLKAGGNSDFASSAFTVFVVCQQVLPPGNTNVVLNKGDGAVAGNSVWEIVSNDFAGKSRFDTFTSAGNNSDAAATYNIHLLQLLEAKRVDNSTKVLYRNGGQIATGGDSGNALNAGATLLGIGNDGGTGSNGVSFDGYVYEIAYYNSALNDTNRAALETYFINKWGIPTSTATLFGPGGNAAVGFSVPESLVCYQSTNQGQTWTTPSGVTNPVFGPFPGPGGVGQTTGTQGGSSILINGQYYAAYEYNVFSGAVTTFGIATSTGLNGPWRYLTDVKVFNSLISASDVWYPQFFRDDDNSIHILINAQNGGGGNDSVHQPMMVDALDQTMMNWSAPTTITGTGFVTNMTDNFIVTPKNSPNGKYNLIVKDDNAKQIGMFSSSNLKSGYTVTYSFASNHFGINGNEAPIMVKIGNIWRLFYAAGTSSASTFIDSFDNWATWITGAACGYPGASNGTAFGLVNTLLFDGTIILGGPTPSTTLTNKSGKWFSKKDYHAVLDDFKRAQEKTARDERRQQFIANYEMTPEREMKLAQRAVFHSERKLKTQFDRKLFDEDEGAREVLRGLQEKESARLAKEARAKVIEDAKTEIRNKVKAAIAKRRGH